MMPPPTSAHPAWGWTQPVRRLLVALTLILGAALLAIAPGAGEPTGPPAPSLRLDPNTAPPEVLAALPGLGPVRAAAIAAERRAGPFRSLAELEARVRGIGPATAEAMAPYLRFPEDLHPGPIPRVGPPAP